MIVAKCIGFIGGNGKADQIAVHIPEQSSLCSHAFITYACYSSAADEPFSVHSKKNAAEKRPQWTKLGGFLCRCLRAFLP